MSTLILLAHLALVGQLAPAAGAPAKPAAGSPAPASPAPGSPAPGGAAPTTPPAEPGTPATEPTPPTAEPTPPTAEPATEPPPPATEPAAAPAEPPTTEAAPPPTKPTPSKPRGVGQFSFYWDMSQTAGSSYRYVNDFSARGFSTAFNYRVIPMLAVGVLVGFSYTDDVVRATRKQTNAALTSTELRTIDTVPIMATISAHIPTGSKGPRGRGWAEPFFGLGIGTYHTFRRADLGWVYGDQSGWHFGLMPSLGVQIDTPGPQVILGSRFNWAAKTDSTPQELYVTFNVGLGFFAF